eukprot:88053-Prorocentrum_minimum.AAC.1
MSAKAYSSTDDWLGLLETVMFFIILASCIGAALAVVYYVHTNTRPLAEIAGKAFPEVSQRG